MKRFEFALAPLLSLRTNDRDNARQDVADALQALELLQQQEQEIETQRQTLYQQTQQLMASQEVSVSTLLAQGRYDLQLQAQVQDCRRQQQLIESEVRRRQEKLQAADVEVKRLEKLCQRQQQAWQTRMQAMQQAELDEVASQRYRGGWAEP